MKPKKGYFTDLSVLSVGGHTFRLKNCIEVNGHDDSLPYTATLYIGNKKVCNLFNDGWGGITEITKIFNKDLLNKAQDDIKGVAWVTYPWEREMSLMAKLKFQTITEITDYIAETYIWFDSFTKNKKLVKKLNYTIIAINKSQEVKTISISHVKNDISGMIERSEKYCNALIKDGWFILNAPHLKIK